MLDSNTISDGVGAPTWAWEVPAWQEVDRKLRSIAKRRATLDAEEARWLREAERLKIWREVGMVNALDYMERVLGYGPRAAQERLRVARVLADLPVMAAALGDGSLPYTAVRELSRVALPSTEREWCEAAAGKNLRQIEELVTGHKPGDRPRDRKDPELVLRRVMLELTPAAYAMWRQSRIDLDAKTDSEHIEALCSPARDDDGRAKFQIATIRCERCGDGFQDGGGVRVPVDRATVERAQCDAQHIGPLNAETPARATQDIPPAVVRLVWRRDGGRCQTPGCRSTRGLEMHHIVHREHGGDHSPANLTLRCFACHQAHHAGRIRIGGRAPDQLTFERAHVGVAEDARAALCGAGWKPHVARTAVDAAIAHVGAEDLAAVIREALRRCLR